MINCPKCGSDERRVLMWDGDRCGGHRTTCAKCGYVLAATEYYENSPGLFDVVNKDGE